MAESQTPTTPASESGPAAEPGGVAADLADERLIRREGFGGYARTQWDRIRSGDLGSLPVILGLIVLCVGFYLADPRFLSSRNVVAIMQFAAPLGVIALGIVLVLLLGEIDISVGSVSGVAAGVMAVLLVNQGVALWISILCALGVGVIVGLFYSALFLWLGIPSFVFSLAGYLGFQGVLLLVLGEQGTINLPTDSGLLDFCRRWFISGGPAYALMAVTVLLYLAAQWWRIVSRRKAGLSSEWLPIVLVKAAALAVVLFLLAYWVSIDRGIPGLMVFFVVLVVVMDFALRRTRWGRHVFAVGGNVEAARRSGIKVAAVYVSVFVLTATFAALGGVLQAGLQTSVSQASGTLLTNLMAIAAAVIGGCSLFGGRGSAYAALLGVLVLQAISNGLNIINVPSEVRFMVTGAVLLLAVAIDSVSSRIRTSSGRG